MEEEVVVAVAVAAVVENDDDEEEEEGDVIVWNLVLLPMPLVVARTVTLSVEVLTKKMESTRAGGGRGLRGEGRWAAAASEARVASEA